MGNETLEERRKKATLKLIERKHAGKITQPYKLLEELIAEHHPELRDAKFIMLWKTGWRADKDGRLTHAKIIKATEAQREVWGDCDYMILLHRELWKCERFTEESRRHDIDHELYHAGPEIDDSTGEQRLDERDRPCWRIVKHKIETFPDLIERYGLKECTGINGQAILDAEREQVESGIAADENDAKRPLLKAAEGNGSAAWRSLGVEVLGIPASVVKKLDAAGRGTLGQLVDLMRAEESWWHKGVPGVGQESAGKVNDALSKFRAQHPEYTDL